MVRWLILSPTFLISLDRLENTWVDHLGYDPVPLGRGMDAILLVQGRFACHPLEKEMNQGHVVFRG